MKRVFAYLFLSALTVLSVSCSKEVSTVLPDNREVVTATVSFRDFTTKATADGDGVAANVNHWVVEVRDVKNPSKIFYREEKDAVAGTKEQTFDLMLVRNQTYDIAFWADCKGCYGVSSLKAAEMLSPVGNKDTFDAFCAAKKTYLCTGNDDISATLTRPLAQLNFIATDLKALEAFVTTAAYPNYEPSDFELTIPVALKYDVYAGVVIESDITSRTVKASEIYGTYSPAAEETTLFMTYVFADSNNTKDLGFKFKSNQVDMGANVTNVPVKTNYRTNIKGNFFTGKVVCNVTVCPNWNEPEVEVSL
ncbi:MAG: hypothetical protein KBS73_05030 [Bacteroidales bacterium]|nr:hypothetical protein [Candidatus Cacconaster equifaecalis]